MKRCAPRFKIVKSMLASLQELSAGLGALEMVAERYAFHTRFFSLFKSIFTTLVRYSALLAITRLNDDAPTPVKADTIYGFS
jgi:hypothetical protein